MSEGNCIIVDPDEDTNIRKDNNDINQSAGVKKTTTEDFSSSKSALPAAKISNTSNSVSSNISSPSFLIEQPNENDVVCSTNNQRTPYYQKFHRGNQYYHELLKQNLSIYATASRLQRSVIISNIIELVHGKGARFVQKDHGGKFVPISDHHVHEKTSQAFRDLLHEQYKSSSAARSQVRNAKRQPQYADASNNNNMIGAGIGTNDTFSYNYHLNNFQLRGFFNIEPASWPISTSSDGKVEINDVFISKNTIPCSMSYETVTDDIEQNSGSCTMFSSTKSESTNNDEILSSFDTNEHYHSLAIKNLLDDSSLSDKDSVIASEHYSTFSDWTSSSAIHSCSRSVQELHHHHKNRSTSSLLDKRDSKKIPSAYFLYHVFEKSEIWS